MMTPRRATLIGLSAILLWSTLAVLTVATRPMPPFQLLAITFGIGACIAPLSWIMRPQAVRALWQPATVWLIGVAGLFGYHALYFVALRLAPPAEAGLLNYLWPLLIVLFSGLLPGERLARHHVLGAALGFVGTALLFAGPGHVALDASSLPGLVAACLAAFVWAAYSVLSRRNAAVPTDVVAGFCAVTAILATLVHLLVETTIWPDRLLPWLAIVALGIGPVGLAFFAWDIGMKRGDIRVLGAVSYAAPLISTGFLIAAGFTQPSLTVALAALLIAFGGLVAARDLIVKHL